MNINNHYRNVLSRYERGENKVSLQERGFKYSYGDECKVKKVKKEKLIMCRWVDDEEYEKEEKKKKKKKKRKIDGQ